MDINPLLLLDNHLEMINSFVGDYHVWYDIRFQILNEIIFRCDKLTMPTSTPLLHLKIITILKYLWSALMKFPYFIKRKEIVFFSSDIMNVKHNEYYVNRLCDFFFSQYREFSVVFEDSFQWEHKVPRRQVVYYSDIIYIISAFLSKFVILTNKTNRELNGVCLNIRSKINYNFDDKFWNGIYLLIKKKYKRHLIEKKIYSCFLKKIQSKVVFCHCGSYGGYQALSIICNRLNIIYVEFQHGLVSRNHQAYNYGEVFVRSDIAKNLLPRYFLTFGKYWSEQIRIPGKTVEVGFPFLLEKALLVKSKKQYHLGITVLVVSDATLPDFYVDLVKKLSNEKYEYPLKIIFKLHPVEAPMLRKWYGSLMEIENVIIKTHESIYNIITDADIIVGCSSTVMFEALQFSLKPFVYVNDYSNAHIDYFCFHTFNDVEDLLRQIREEKYIHEEQDIAKNVDYIWEQHPRECFRKFINGILDGKAHG